jgi:hypothetical protein
MLVSIREAAGHMGVPVTSFWNWLKKHPEIERINIGCVVALKLEDVEQYKAIRKPRVSKR